MCEDLEWKELPTEPGWYWYKERSPVGRSHDVVISVVEVFCDAKMGEMWLLVEDYCGGVPLPEVAKLDLLWLGPIQQPPVGTGQRPFLQAGYGLYFRPEEKVM